MVDEHHRNNFIKRTCLWSSSTRGVQFLVEMIAMLIHVYLILFYTTHLFVSGSTQSSHTCVNFAPPRIRSIWTAVSVVCLGNLRFSDCSHPGLLVPRFKCQDPVILWSPIFLEYIFAIAIILDHWVSSVFAFYGIGGWQVELSAKR